MRHVGFGARLKLKPGNRFADFWFEMPDVQRRRRMSEVLWHRQKHASEYA
jgi:hypothetical protein